ncbi:MAG: hydrogenase maturation protease [Prochloraceae cyanobacterium]|nr:hydrogenase maturation protease [Prochloraceae cyanobacterium]
MLTIIGCGNLNRSDDGVGAIVARRLQRWLQTNSYTNVQVFDCGTAGMEVMFQARGSTSLIVIDASSTDSEAGAIYKVPGKILEKLPEPSYNLHDFRWDNAIAVGKEIFHDDFPQDVTVYLIEAENLNLGLTLSSRVERAAEKVLSELIEIVARESKLCTN